MSLLVLCMPPKSPAMAMHAYHFAAFGSGRTDSWGNEEEGEKAREEGSCQPPCLELPAVYLTW